MENMFQFGPGRNKKKPKPPHRREPTMTESDAVLIYDPLTPDKNGVEKTLDKCIANINAGNCRKRPNNDIVLGHIWKDEICLANASGRKEWRDFTQPESKEFLIDNTNWELRESNITQRIDQFTEKTGIKAEMCSINKISEGADVIECNYQDINAPFIFTLSFCGVSNYFDMVCIPHKFSDEKQTANPICYMHWKKSPDDVLVKHSGDLRKLLPSNARTRDKSIGLDSSLMQYLKIDKSTTNLDYTSGYVVFHAYDNKTLFALADTEPNICIVDKIPNSDSFNIWVYHLPIVEDILGNSSVAFIARFDIDSDRKKIIWHFSKTPTLISEKFEVGHIQMYNNGLGKFRDKLLFSRVSNSSNPTKKLKLDKLSIAESTIEDASDVNAETEKILFIVQEPLLSEKSIENFINNLCQYIQSIKEMECKKYSFHHCIKKLKLGGNNNNNYEGYYEDCKFSLPIAGGSIISDCSLIKLCQPIESGAELADEYRDDLKTCRGAIVIVSNDYSVGNFPKIYSKLNACYVVINTDTIDNKRKCKPVIDKLLNETNLSMANALQGPLSSIIGYFPNIDEDCYFIRGFAGQRGHEMTFGTALTSYEDVIQLACCTATFTSKPSRIHFTQASTYSFIDHCGTKALMNVDIRGDAESISGEDIYYRLTNDAERWAKDEFLMDENIKGDAFNDDMNKYLSCILAQMEVLFDFKTLQDLFVTAKRYFKGIDSNNAPTNRNVFDMLRGQKEILPYLSQLKLSQFLEDKDQMAKPFKLNWFMDVLSNDRLLEKNVRKFSLEYIEVINTVRVYCENRKRNNGDFPERIKKNFLSILVGKSHECISTKSSYGKRGLDIEKIIKKDNIKKNVALVDAMSKFVESKESEELDRFFEDSCSKAGYIIFRILPQQFLRIIRKVNNDDNFLAMDPSGRFVGTCGDLLASFLATSRGIGDKSTDGYVFRYTDNSRGDENLMIAIPVLDVFIDVMQDGRQITEYPWSKAKEGDAIDLSRILLRKSLHNLASEYLTRKEMSSLSISESSPFVGYLVMKMLEFASQTIIKKYQKEKKLTLPNDDRRLIPKYHQTDENLSDDHYLVKCLRGINGLLISVMASGSERELNSAYKCLIYNAERKISPGGIKLKFGDDKYWLEYFMKIEPYLQIKNNVSFNDNIISNVVFKLKYQCQNIINTSKNNKNILELKKNNYRRNLWDYDVVRPLVLAIVDWYWKKGKFGDDSDFFRDIDYENVNVSPMILKLPISEMKMFVANEDVQFDYSDMKNNGMDIDEIELELEKLLEKNKDFKSPKRIFKTLIKDLDDNDVKFVRDFLNLYRLLTNEYDNEDFPINSYFYNKIKRLEELMNDNQNIRNAWTYVVSTALDIYMRQSGIFCALVKKLLFKPLNDIIRKIVCHTKAEIDTCNCYLSVEHNQFMKKCNGGDLINASVALRYTRAKIFKVFLAVVNPFYQTCYIPNVIKILSSCKKLDDFIYNYVGIDEMNNHFAKLQKRGNLYNKSEKSNWIRKNEDKGQLPTENISLSDQDLINTIKNGADIELQCQDVSGSEEKRQPRFLYQFVKQFNPFKVNNYEKAKKDKEKFDADIKRNEKLLRLEVIQDSDVAMMTKWLCDRNEFHSVDWGNNSKYLCYHEY